MPYCGSLLSLVTVVVRKSIFVCLQNTKSFRCSTHLDYQKQKTESFIMFKTVQSYKDLLCVSLQKCHDPHSGNTLAGLEACS